MDLHFLLGGWPWKKSSKIKWFWNRLLWVTLKKTLVFSPCRQVSAACVRPSGNIVDKLYGKFRVPPSDLHILKQSKISDVMQIFIYFRGTCLKFAAFSFIEILLNESWEINVISVHPISLLWESLDWQGTWLQLDYLLNRASSCLLLNDYTSIYHGVFQRWCSLFVWVAIQN
jgi:hypothetical protein